MNTFTKTEVFLTVFVQKRSSVNGALGTGLLLHGPFRVTVNLSISNQTSNNVFGTPCKQKPRNSPLNWLTVAQMTNIFDMYLSYSLTIGKYTKTEDTHICQ